MRPVDVPKETDLLDKFPRSCDDEPMPRTSHRKSSVTPDPQDSLSPVEFEDEELAALAKVRHAMSVQMSEYDWHRALEAARLQDSVSVSDVMRQALHVWLDRHPQKSHIDSIAKLSLQFELQAQAARKAATTAKVPIQQD